MAARVQPASDGHHLWIISLLTPIPLTATDKFRHWNAIWLEINRLKISVRRAAFNKRRKTDPRRRSESWKSRAIRRLGKGSIFHYGLFSDRSASPDPSAAGPGSSASVRNPRAVLRRRPGSLRATASRMSDSIEYARTVTTLSTRSNPECRNGNLMTARIDGSVGEYGSACREVLRSRPAGFGEDRVESVPGRDRVNSSPSRDDRRARCPGGVP